MPRCPTKRFTDHAIRKPTHKEKREITVDDVIGALLDLFAKLEINAPQLASRVKALDRTAVASHRLYAHSTAIGDLLTAWHQNPNYLDKLGNPLPIKMRGPKRSFDLLAKDAVRNMDASTLLTELQRVGAVAIDKDRFIHARMRALSVYEDKPLAIQHTLISLHSFIRTLRHNLNSDPSNSDQLFHRVAWNGAFDSHLIPTLKIKVKRQGQNLLESFDNWMMRKTKTQTRGSRHRGKPVQIFIGVYLAVGKE